MHNLRDDKSLPRVLWIQQIHENRKKKIYLITCKHLSVNQITEAAQVQSWIFLSTIQSLFAKLKFVRASGIQALPLPWGC